MITHSNSFSAILGILLLHILLILGLVLGRQAMDYGKPQAENKVEAGNAFQFAVKRTLLDLDSNVLKKSDAYHYNTIRTEGYSFHPDKQSNVAFFPGFPLLWRYSGLSAAGISLLNILLFLVGLLILANTFRMSAAFLLLVASIPSMIFMYVPYSEALFFVSAAVLLRGLYRREVMLAVLGLALCCFTRSAANVFLPAVIILALTDRDQPIYRTILLIGTICLSVFLAVWVHYSETGQWWGFMQTQKHWFHGLQWPKFPFSTWGNMELLDGAALLFGIFCGILSVWFIWQKVAGDKVPDPAFFFSILVISGLTAFALLLKGGVLFSLNRYLLPTAFLAVAGWFLLPSATFTGKRLAYALLVIFLFLTLMHFFVHIQVILRFLALTLYLGLYLVLRHPDRRIANSALVVLYLVNVALQCRLLFIFLKGNWVA